MILMVEDMKQESEYVQINVSEKTNRIVESYAGHYESIYGIPFTNSDVIEYWAESHEGGGRL